MVHSLDCLMQHVRRTLSKQAHNGRLKTKQRVEISVYKQHRPFILLIVPEESQN